MYALMRSDYYLNIVLPELVVGAWIQMASSGFT